MSNPEPTDTPRQLKVGDQLGQYKLVELLARGGMGLVYRAYDSGLKRFVAVKVLAPELVRDTEVAQRFFDEAPPRRSTTRRLCMCTPPANTMAWSILRWS